METEKMLNELVANQASIEQLINTYQMQIQQMTQKINELQAVYLTNQGKIEILQEIGKDGTGEAEPTDEDALHDIPE